MAILTVTMDTLQNGTVDGEDEPGDFAGGEVAHGHLVEPAGSSRVGAEKDDATFDLGTVRRTTGRKEET